jgi:hypothetical protein
MKLKITLIVFLFVVCALSIVEIFPVMPKAAAWYPWYKSDYFSEIDRQYDTILDSFLSMKLYGKNDNAWLFLGELSEKSGVAVKVYDANGDLVTSPGETAKGTDEQVMRIAQSSERTPVSRVTNGHYYRAVPVIYEKQCRICHQNRDSNGLAGIVTFERQVDGMLYFTAERRIVFSVIALVCLILIFLALRWDPHRSVRDLFNK